VQWSTRQVGGGGGGAGAGAGAGLYGVVGMVMVGVVMVWCVSVLHLILFKQLSPSGPTVAMETLAAAMVCCTEVVGMMWVWVVVVYT
jgi:hypothetical protein